MIGYEFNYVLSCGCPYAAIAPRPQGGWVTCFPHGEVTVVKVLGSDVAECCRRHAVSRPGAVCMDGAGCKKPHLRLHYRATQPDGSATAFQWEVEYIRGPSKRVRQMTYWTDSCWGALMGAATLWFPEWCVPMVRAPYRKPR